MPILRYFNWPELSEAKRKQLAEEIDNLLGTKDAQVDAEACFHVVLADGTDVRTFDETLGKRLEWLLSKPIGDQRVTKQSRFVQQHGADGSVIEIGPRLSFTTAFSTNAVSACRSAGLNAVIRLEKSIRYQIITSEPFKDDHRNALIDLLSDRMTEMEYVTPPDSFESQAGRQPIFEIDLMGEHSMDNLKKANMEMGLAFDNDDLNYYHDLFVNHLRRNPTNVELFDLAQSNSEHSRHWFFKGRMVVDGHEQPMSLFQRIQDTQKHSNQNNIIAFNDNSSAIRGFPVTNYISKNPSVPSQLDLQEGIRHLIYTAETHNFPTGVCPFPGAATGTGGRIRDVHATGRGAHEIAGVAGYSFGNLRLPGYVLPWEDEEAPYPHNFAHPRQIAIQASNGASDYGNKFGEPLIAGFARSFGQTSEISGERREWIKPIMFSGGIGAIDDQLTSKLPPTKDLLVAKIGGPVYRIGVGGGAASSVQVQGGEANRSDQLDFGAVQRGDAEMEQKVHRLIRSCIETGKDNPILSIHDQGAGGNGNVLKELVEAPSNVPNCGGAVINVNKFDLGDPTLSVQEVWGAEYQESNAALLNPERLAFVEAVSRRERCPLSIVGQVTGDNRIILTDFDDSSDSTARHPVDLDLGALGARPPKTFHLESTKSACKPLVLPDNLSVADALERVLRLPSVASKRYLTNKVDRSVTGLIAQQQCVGPLHTPVADVAVVALSYFDTTGGAVAVGEQPIKGLISAAVGSRMSVGEALTNLVFAPITDLRDVKCSGNWMWAAKLPGEGAQLVRASDAMCEVMKALGVAVDGGKDSLSMAAKVGNEIVKAPGALVVSAYAPCVDITRTVTPDLKGDGNRDGVLVYVRFGDVDWRSNRLGGSALAQCYKQVGDNAADLDSPETFVSAFSVLQSLIKDDMILAGHDVSDGGLVTCLLEMAFAGNRSINVDMHFESAASPVDVLFAEELGVVVELKSENVDSCLKRFDDRQVFASRIGTSGIAIGPDAEVKIALNNTVVLDGSLVYWRSVWEETSYRLELRQTNPECAEQEQQFLRSASQLPWTIAFEYGKSATNGRSTNGHNPTNGHSVTNGHNTNNGNNATNGHATNGNGAIHSHTIDAARPLVAIIREEGSNGDREMAAAFHMAGFESWDVTMSDLLAGAVDLNRFRGIAFVGGFSYGDVLGSAKGWASAIKFHPAVAKMFEDFRRRSDTFSFGVCNGCQLMALLGWVGNVNEDPSAEPKATVLLDHNDCGRFQSYFSSVRVVDSPAIMLRGMSDSVIGVWSSHGEGKFTFSDGGVLDSLERQQLAPLRFVDENGKTATTYPMNPNGSERGVAALCSADGRHLAMMPHPDRSFLSWQWPYWPANWPKANDHRAPWMKLFDNAYHWVMHNS